MLLIQKNKILGVCLLAITFLFNQSALAQVKDDGRGYYVNAKGEKVEGFFDFEFINNNLVRFKGLKQDAVSFLLPIEDVNKIVLPTDNKDSSVILTQNLVFKDEKEKIYIQYLQKGDINLFRGFSKAQKEIFYISKNDLPDIRRINRTDPKQFLITYFKGCEDAKRTIRAVFYEKSSIEFALRQFAECTNKKMATEYKPKTQILKRKPIFVGLAVQGGFFKPRINPGYDKLTKYKLSSSSGALGLNIQMLIVGQYSISCGFNYIFDKLHTTDNTFLYPNLTTISYNRSEIIPIELKYRFKNEQKKLNYGMSIGMLTSHYSHLKFDGYQSHPPSANQGIGFFLTGCMNTPLTKKMGLEIGTKISATFATLVPPTSIDRYITEELTNRTLNFDIFARVLLNVRE